MQLRIVDRSATSTTCGHSIINRNVTYTIVGQTWAATGNLGGRIAGLYAVDAVLPEAELAVIIARMHHGEDPLQACAACPSPLMSPQGSIGQQACNAPCNAGYTGSPCTACQAGSYKPVQGPQACANPPANAFTPNTVSWLCNAGFSEPVVADACSACGAGKYKEASGNDALDCLDCKDYSESPPSTISAASCLCVQGYAADGSALDTCVECAKGKYKAASANAACTDCPGGSTTLAAKAFDVSLCVADAGFHKVSGAFQACPVGSFKPQEGDAACTPCPTHSTTPAAGAVASSQCVCVAPKYQAHDSACGCAPGFFYVGASQACEPCPAGSFCLGTQAGGALATTAATPCPANTDSDAGAVSMAACACRPGYAGAITTTANNAQHVLLGRYFAGTTDILADSSEVNAPLQKWTPAANNRDSTGWGGVQVMKVPAVTAVVSGDLVSFASAVPPRLNTANLLGTSTTAAFY